MNKTTQFFIGIDVSKPYFDATLLSVINHVKQDMITERFDNNNIGLKSNRKYGYLPPCVMVILQ